MSKMNKRTNKMLYTFIHPTKCGGTSCEKFFKQHYKDYIVGEGHVNKCSDDNNPIIIVRDVYSRFISMFNYWKNGSQEFKKNNRFRALYQNKSILDFIEMIKCKDTNSLYKYHLWDDHFKCTSEWINNAKYKNIIVIVYEKNLNEKIQKLLQLLQIPNRKVQLPIQNVSFVNEEDMKVYEEHKEYIHKFVDQHFRSDVELMEKIKKHPEEFKIVI